MPIGRMEVWDLPVRLGHWLLVLLVVTACVTGYLGGDAMEIHLWAGYGIATLVTFRILWGCVGSTYARFGSFVRGIPTTLAYCYRLCRGEAATEPGHNPLGGWMVLCLLAALAFQAGTGLFANDDILTEGPLFNWVGKEASDYLTALHKLNFKIVATLAGVHVLAIVFYLAVKRINLIRPMITGCMPVSDPTLAGQRIARHFNLLALALLAAISCGFYLLVR